MDYKKMMGYDEKKKESKPKVNKVLNSNLRFHHYL